MQKLWQQNILRTPKLSQPLTNRQIIIFLLCVVVFQGLVIGYINTQRRLLDKEYRMIEDKYVRLRNTLGRDTTQELLDASYELETEP